MENTILWILFVLGVLPLLMLDLGVLRRKGHEIKSREALLWSLVWIGLALLFCGTIFAFKGTQSGMEFLTGYVVEKTLSVDNVFLFVMIFNYFQVPIAYQHRVLFWGVIGAILMRAVMIGMGSVLIEKFHGVLFLFGTILILTGIKTFLHRNQHMDMGSSRLLVWMKQHIPFTEQFQGQYFVVRLQERWLATPLFLTLIMVECTDLVFAVDSIPAIFAVTTDPFIIFTSNVFAILGLRALYFLLADMMTRFHYLKAVLSAILIFVGTRMLLPFKVPILLSLGVILGILILSALASIWKSQQEEAQRPLERKTALAAKE